MAINFYIELKDEISSQPDIIAVFPLPENNLDINVVGGLRLFVISTQNNYSRLTSKQGYDS